MDRLDRAYGALVGGAIGDAMGMPASFLTRQQIRTAYGYIQGSAILSRKSSGRGDHG